jgi:poly(3-hydroxyalkanoate) synthetase
MAQEVALQLDVTHDQAFIRDELEMMLSFLMAAHEERDKNMVTETWVKQVRIVAYDVEDSLMDFAVHVEKKSWWLPWRIPRTLHDRRHVAKQMKDLRAKVEDVSQRKRRYLVVGGCSSKVAASAGDTAATAAAMFGINEARYAAKMGQSRLDLNQLINKEGEDLGVIAV